MTLKREIQISGKPVEVYEMSVAKVREWLKNQSATQESDLIDCLLFEDFNIADFYIFTSLTQADVDSMHPSQLRLIIDSIKEINPCFFSLQDRLVGLGKSLVKAFPNAS